MVGGNRFACCSRSGASQFLLPQLNPTQDSASATTSHYSKHFLRLSHPNVISDASAIAYSEGLVFLRSPFPLHVYLIVRMVPNTLCSMKFQKKVYCFVITT